MQTDRYVTPVTWLEAPAWLTLEQAAELTGHTGEDIQEIIAVGGVDWKEDAAQVLIEKGSLYDFQEALLDVLHWEDD